MISFALFGILLRVDFNLGLGFSLYEFFLLRTIFALGVYFWSSDGMDMEWNWNGDRIGMEWNWKSNKNRHGLGSIFFRLKTFIRVLLV